jgi:hypothetical protein
MQSSLSPQSAASLPWSEVLERLEATVARAVAEAAERARQLETAASAAVPGPSSWEEALETLRLRCQGVETCAAGAAAKVAEVDAALAEAEQGLQAWLRATGAAREKLAGWVGRAVG